MKQYFVYILTNHTHSVLYIGVTNNIVKRIQEHKEGSIDGFSKRYHLTILVFIEALSSVNDAIAIEKKLKGWTRKKKEALIESQNQEWKDLSA